MVKALSRALHYALPFDLKGALKRRAMHIPDRFSADRGCSGNFYFEALLNARVYLKRAEL